MISHHKSPFIFFLIILSVSFAGIGYIYFHNYSTNADILWSDASLKITTNWGTCSPKFPCYETYLLDNGGNIFHNDELEGKLSEAKNQEVINKAFNLYHKAICTPFHEPLVTQNYELKVDENIYDFGNKEGCAEMQSVLTTFQESINI